MATCIRTALKNRLRDRFPESQAWFQKKFGLVPPAAIPVYSSYDLRDADYKIAPVDANMFPAGFNNICEEDLDAGPPLVHKLFQQILGRTPKSVVIIPENHTRNHFYAENLYELRQLLRRAGIETEIGWWEDKTTTEPAPRGPDNAIHLETPQGQELKAYPVTAEGARLTLPGFDPEFILFNNDFSAGVPSPLLNLKQPVGPHPKWGWHTRRKSTFFEHYNQTVLEYAQFLDIDPWPLSVMTERIQGVDFLEGTGLDRVTETVSRTLTLLQKQYKDRCISEKPFVFIKNNAGTYGIGVMKVSDPEELLRLNRRDRNKMHVGKGNQVITDIIVQEGIPTRFQVEGAYAEPVIYLMGHELLGGFLRKNPGRGKDENLNTRGMVFQKLCISDLRREADRDLELELVFGTVAQISAVALSRELQTT